MDWKSLVQKKWKMKFFYFTQISNSPFQYWTFPDGVQDILAPSHRLSDQYSMHHNQQPENGAPNISVSAEEIQFEAFVRFDLLASSLNYTLSKMEDIQRVHELDLYSQHPLIFEHSHYCKPELLSHEFGAEFRLVKHEIYRN